MQHRPTLEDVARHAGVSRALVSIVMRDVPGASDETRARVRRAADEIGYRPDPRARRLRQLRTKLLGVTFAAGQEFHAELVDGVYAAADEFGYEVVLSGVTRHHDEQRAVRTLLDDRCEAVLLLGPELPAGGYAAWTPSAATTPPARRWPSSTCAVSGIATSSTSTVAGYPAPPSGAAVTRKPCAPPTCRQPPCPVV